MSVGQVGEGVLGFAGLDPLVIDAVDFILGGLKLLFGEFSVLILVNGLNQYVAEGDAIVVGVVAAGVEDHDVVAAAVNFDDAHVALGAVGAQHPLGEGVGKGAADVVAKDVAELVYLGALDLIGDGFGKVRAALDGLGDAVGNLLGVGHGGVGDLLIGLLLAVFVGRGDLLALSGDQVVVEGQRVKGVGVLVVVGVELIGGVLETVEYILGVVLGDVRTGEQVADKLAVHALAVGGGQIAVGPAQIVVLGQGGIGVHGVVNSLGILLGEGVALVGGGVVQGGHLDHVFQGGLTEIVVPGEGLGRVVAG